MHWIADCGNLILWLKLFKFKMAVCQADNLIKRHSVSNDSQWSEDFTDMVCSYETCLSKTCKFILRHVLCLSLFWLFLHWKFDGLSSFLLWQSWELQAAIEVSCQSSVNHYIGVPYYANIHIYYYLHDKLYSWSTMQHLISERSVQTQAFSIICVIHWSMFLKNPQVVNVRH